MSEPTPNLFSLEFHLKFFPRFLWERLRPKKKEVEGVSFSNNFELMILLAACLILAVIGIPLALKNASIVGWAMGLLGIGGFLVILITSIRSQLDTRPSFDNFLIWSFLFFVFLGINAGIYFGKEQHSFILNLLSIFLGIFVGYLAGILAGLGLQYLGWVAIMVNMMLGCAIIGVVILDLVLLFVK